MESFTVCEAKSLVSSVNTSFKKLLLVLLSVTAFDLIFLSPLLPVHRMAVERRRLLQALGKNRRHHYLIGLLRSLSCVVVPTSTSAELR